MVRGKCRRFERYWGVPSSHEVSGKGEINMNNIGRTQLPTSISLSLWHSSHPPSHRFFSLFTQTSLLPVHSGLAPSPNCIGGKGVLVDKVPCQSHSHTVAMLSSLSTLRSV